MGMITSFDHVNLRTANLAAMTEFYTQVLGLRNGHRPKFNDDGAWIYLGDNPVVHLVDAKDATVSGADTEVTLEHFAFSAKGFKAFSKVLDEAGVDYNAVPVSAIKMVQVNLRDPDGNHIHIDFTEEDAAG